MIIFPTEKSLSWQHAPLMVIAIVLLNILIFVFYQSGDGEKAQRALDRYQNNEFFELEWPHYKLYLEAQFEAQSAEAPLAGKELSANKEPLASNEALNDAIELYQDEDIESLEMIMLLDESFYQYLLTNKQQEFDIVTYGFWSEERGKVANALATISSTRFGVIPADLTVSGLIMHQFMHGGVMHIIGNMLFLIIFGFAVEAVVGHLRFLLMYIASGIGAAAFFALIHSGSHTPLVGASGAISGVMAMYLAAFRFKKIEFFYWFFVFVGYFRAPALLILPLYIGKEFVQFFSQLYGEGQSNVAFMAHVGGFLSGAALMLALYFIKPDALNDEYIEADESDDQYQQALAKVHAAIDKFRFNDALRLLDQLTQDYGASFEHSHLRYVLIKATQPEDFLTQVSQLLSEDAPTLAMVSKQKRMWQENPEVQSCLTQQQLLDLGIKFSTSNECRFGEQIFLLLRQQRCQLQGLPVLARRLSLSYEQQRNSVKMREFSRIADELLTGSL